MSYSKGKSKPNSRWQLQHSHLVKHKNGFNAVDFIDVEFKSDAVLAESQSQHKLLSTDCTRYVLKTVSRLNSLCL